MVNQIFIIPNQMNTESYKKRLSALLIFIVSACAVICAQDHPLAPLTKIKGVECVTVNEGMIKLLPAKDLASITGLAESELKKLKMVDLLSSQQRNVNKEVLEEFEKLKKQLGLTLLSRAQDGDTVAEVYQGKTADKKYPLLIAVASESSELVITAVVGDFDVSKLINFQ